MGLFTNNKKLCPICNNPTPRIFATAVEGTAICKKCSRKIDLPDGTLPEMSMEEFRQYMDFYNENQALRDTFTETSRISFGFFAGALLLDKANGLFRLKDNKEALVMEAFHLVSFRILEDDKPLYESDGNVLRSHRSNVPEIVNSMAPQIEQFAMQMRVYEEMERMERERQRERERNGESTEIIYHSRPTANLPLPFSHFYVELNMEHPYWNGFRGKMAAPEFSDYDPSIDNYLREYREKVDLLHAAAVDFMQMICPGAGEICDDAGPGTVSVQAEPAIDAVSEIQRYKELMDSGVITEEEFTAKKRQLLGI